MCEVLESVKMTAKTATQLFLKNPPVAETSLTIQFSDLPEWSSLHHGLYYLTLKDRFPVYRQRPAVPPLLLPFPLVPNIRQLQITPHIEPGRAEFLADPDNTLIAVQNNRFSFHWRNREDGSYPSYATNREVSAKEFHAFEEFCKKEKAGEIKSVLVEVMYANKIIPEEGETLADACEDILGLTLGEFEAVTVNRTFVLENNRGRLYTELNSFGHETGKPFLTFQLSSRVRHSAENDVMTTMDLAHDWLIENFCKLTSDTARRNRWQQE